MDRREAIRRTAFLMGGVASASSIIGILQGCTAKPALDWKPIFFNENQAAVVSQIAEIYIPKTETPGAKELGIPAFIEEMVGTIYKVQDKDRFMMGLDEFMKNVETETGDAFWALEPERQVDQVRKAHDKAIAEEGAFWSKLESTHGETYPRPFILQSKELTMLGFFTTEVGASQVLQYEPVPGAYFGCKPLSEVGGKTWAV